MTTDQESPRVASASREIAAGAGTIFELIADPAQQPRWDGNDNLAAAAAGQRVRRAGDVFTMRITYDWTRLTDKNRFPRAQSTAGLRWTRARAPAPAPPAARQPNRPGWPGTPPSCAPGRSAVSSTGRRRRRRARTETARV